MTINRTTELLRKLLEIRGLSCDMHYLHISWRVGSKLYDAVDNLDGTLVVNGLTPEQAVAATLGGKKLTAYQVREAIEKRFDFDVWVPSTRWQAIADELNAKLGMR